MSPYGPYGPQYPPPYPYPAPQIANYEPVKPPVWTWYIVYAVFMAVTYIVVMGLGVLLAFVADKSEDGVQGVIMAVVGLPLAIMYGLAPFRAKTSGAWTYHLVLICLGLTSACCIPICLPLLIFWLKPETKAFFGRM